MIKTWVVGADTEVSIQLLLRFYIVDMGADIEDYTGFNTTLVKVLLVP